MFELKIRQKCTQTDYGVVDQVLIKKETRTIARVSFFKLNIVI